jgi:CheY-like chemotaxis protein
VVDPEDSATAAPEGKDRGMTALKLLVVEDDIANLELTAEVLRSLKAEVRPVSDSQEAARLIQHEKFDGIFLDLEMPRVDGFELARQIRKSSWNRSTPIVIVTGREDRRTMQQAFEIGATFFLQKPVDRQRLSRLFETVRGGLIENRRRHLRIPLRVEVGCEVGSRTLRCVSCNLSQGGMLLEAGELHRGETVRVGFQLPGSGAAIEATAVVAWQEEKRFGIEFAKLSPQVAELLRKFIAEAEK